jgi:osmotically-inducible protein OsmY
MRCQGSFVLAITLVAIATFSGCATSSAKSPDVSAVIKASFGDAGLKAISVAQDRHKAVVTLTGKVSSDMERSEAESIARSLASGEIVGNEIEVISADNGSATVEFDSEIATQVRVTLLQHQLRRCVRYAVKGGVVTLTGEVDSPEQLVYAQSLTKDVPNVRQVVNELQIANQKAISAK